MRKSLLFILIGFFVVNTSFGWGANGHRIIGEIADSYLSKKARKNIAAILGNESVAMSSNWADFIKSDSTMKYLDPWHYINIKMGMEYAAFETYLKQDTAVDAYTKLNFLIGELKKKKLTTERKQFCLRMLIHIAGDIHQPMHVSRAEDLGGNRIRVQWFNDPANLHAVWDDRLIEQQKLSYTEFAAYINHTTKELRATWQQQPMEQWFFESYQLADSIYNGITPPEQKLGFRYNYDYIGIVNQQLLKAGVRLAGLLNQLFG
ncbi:MAG: S1/P1 nuclease [Chitinophagaceae bacterium]|nr:S1/P1 nuclease [Chitinophagaceae bacterium]